MYFPREKGGGGTEPAGHVVQDPDVGQTQYQVDLQGYKLTVGNSVKPGRYIQTISQQTEKTIHDQSLRKQIRRKEWIGNQLGINALSHRIRVRFRVRV